MTQTPALPLYDYQRAWIEDKSRFKVGMWSRQSGKSFSSSLEVVLDCFERRTDWLLLSAGERQAKKLVATCKAHARALGAAIDSGETSYNAGTGESYNMLEIKFRNGSTITGLPANPDTARGWSANVFLDEFAIHKDSREIWSALFPTATRGYRIILTSTPKGKQNKFYELWSGNPRYSKHKITIFDAVEQGLELLDEDGAPSTPEDLREALADEDAWQQEYLCEFLDEATAFITYDLLAGVEDQKIDITAPEYQGGEIYGGVDVGRKRDLTVLWIAENVGGVLWTREVIEMEKTPFSSQRETIFDKIERLHPRRVCFDATGLGMQLAEEAKEKFGGSTVEEITFTGKVKEDLAVTARRRFEDRQVRIPVDHRIREDLHSVKRYVTSAGNIRFDAERTQDGHADRFWSLALCCHAASTGHAPIEYHQAQAGRRSEFEAGAY